LRIKEEETCLTLQEHDDDDDDDDISSLVGTACSILRKYRTGVIRNAYKILIRKPNGKPHDRPYQTIDPRLELIQILNRV
jgi:hypothetical protein